MPEEAPRAYDRTLLLLGSKRNAILTLDEVRRYGSDSYGDPDYVSIYGLRPEAWFARGIRMLGRTAVECTRDPLADAIAHDIAAVARRAAQFPTPFVLDPFAGSGNTLYWILRHLPGARGIGFELDDRVFELTSANFSRLDLPIEVVHADYRPGLAQLEVPGQSLLIAFIAPPWGTALDPATGLDLGRTTPPVVDIIDALDATFAGNPLLCAVQVCERIEPRSLARLIERFDWTDLRIYDFNAPGENHGILLGTRGWARRP